MPITYVCGHRNPDTDSIVAAMAYAGLRKALGDDSYVPVRLGHLNDETAFLLRRFGAEAPQRLTTVRTQVRDLDIDRPPKLDPGVPVSRAWEMMQENPAWSILPVVREDGTLFGMVTTGRIAEHDMRGILDPTLRETPIFNVLSALEGHILNANDDAFETMAGEVTIAMPAPGESLRGVKEDSIVLCGDREEVVVQALALGVRCIILCQSSLAERYSGLDSPTCVIATPFDAWRAGRMLFQAIPVRLVAHVDSVVCFHLDDFLDDVRETVMQHRYRSFPVLDEADRVVGTLTRYHLIRPNRKRVVLVDHNEKGQSVPGLEQAEIAGIIDHHRLGDVETGYPVFVRNEPVGSSNTIIATMYQEAGLLPGERLAGLMAAAIVSDTVMFKSPTTTPRDRRMAERLARIAGLDLDALGKEIFSVSTADKPAADLLRTDFKDFHIAGHTLAISQITTTDSAAMLARREEFLEAMAQVKEKGGYDMVLLMLTDVLREGTELLFLGDGEVIRQAFSLQEASPGGVFLKGVVSRKKQVVPALALLWG